MRTAGTGARWRSPSRARAFPWHLLQKDALETGRYVKEAGQNALLLPGDIGSPAHCRSLIEMTRKGLGGIDLLVNKAAHQRTFKALADIPEGEFERRLQINLFAMFYLCQTALPHLPVGASIINIASIQAFGPGETLLPYATSKSAVASFTKALAPLGIQRGVSVNAVAPGPVWTPCRRAIKTGERAIKTGKIGAIKTGIVGLGR